jgi:hypothetical protein
MSLGLETTEQLSINVGVGLQQKLLSTFNVGLYRPNITHALRETEIELYQVEVFWVVTQCNVAVGYQRWYPSDHI